MDHSSPNAPMAIESKFTQLLLHYRFLSQALLANSQTSAPERKIFNELENTFASLFDSNPAKIAKLTACSENDSLLAKSGSDPNNNPFSVWKLAEWVNSVKNLIVKLSPEAENKVNGTSKQIIISKPTANIHHYYVKEVSVPKRKFPVPETSTPKSFDDQSKKRKVDFDKSSSSEIEIESEDDFSPSDLLAEPLPEQPSTSAKTENVKTYSLRSDRPRRQSAAIAAAKLREAYEDEEDMDDMDDIILLDSTEANEKSNEDREDNAGDTEVENLVVNCDPFSLFPDCDSESITKEPAKQSGQPFSANPLPSSASRIVSPLNGAAPRMYIPFNPSLGSSTSRPMLARPLTSIISRPTITSQLPVPSSLIARAIASGKPMMAPNVSQHSSNLTAAGKSLGKVLMINSVPYLICSDKDKLNMSTSTNTSSSNSQLVNSSPSTPSSSSNTQGIRHPVTVKLANVNGLRGSTASVIRVNLDGTYSAAVSSNAKPVSEIITIDSDDEDEAPGQQIIEKEQSNITPGNNNTSTSGEEVKDKEDATVDNDHSDDKGETEQETEIPPECASKDDETKDKENVVDDNDQIDNCNGESEPNVEISKEETSNGETKVMEEVSTVDSDQVVATAETGTKTEIPQEGPNNNIVTYDLTDESSRSSEESNNVTDTGDSVVDAADEGDSPSAVPKAKRRRGRPRKHSIHVDAKAETGPETEISREQVSESVITKDLTDESSCSSVKSDNVTDAVDSIAETGDSQGAIPKAKRGRGRPRKNNIHVDGKAETEPETEIPQERPNKNLVTSDFTDESSRSSFASSNLTDTGDSVIDDGDSQSATPKAKRGRGRPRKYKKSVDNPNLEGKGSPNAMAKRPLRSKNEISDGPSTA